jgi:hypothetical protein
VDAAGALRAQAHRDFGSFFMSFALA